MLKIGIIGAENSHAAAFTEIFNKRASHSGMRVTAVAGDYPDANEKLFHDGGLELLCREPSEMLGKVDAVMVTARDGRRHFAFAKPFIEAGIPAFIDKPFTSDPAEARELASLIAEKRVPVTGGSSIKLSSGAQTLRSAHESSGDRRGGVIYGPVSMENEYGGFWFYAAHVIETALYVFGTDYRRAAAVRTPTGVRAGLIYDDFAAAAIFEDHYNNYGGLVFGDSVTYTEISQNGIYDRECDEFAEMLRTGVSPRPIDFLVRSVECIAEIKASI